MSVRLRVQTMGGTCCEITPGEDWTAPEVKRWIQRELGVPVAQQRLLYGGRALRDTELDAGALAALLPAAARGDEPLKLTLLVRSPAAAAMLEAVSRDELALRHAAEEFTQDNDIVLAAVETTHALHNAAEELKRDRELVMAAVEKAPIRAAIRRRRAQARQGARHGGRREGPPYELRHAAEELKRNRELVMAAVERNSYALRYAAEELTRDKELVMAAVERILCTLEYDAEEHKRDKELVLAAVERDTDALRYAAEELKRDKEVLMAAGRLMR